MKRSLFSIVALLVVLSMVLAACGATPKRRTRADQGARAHQKQAEDPRGNARSGLSRDARRLPGEGHRRRVRGHDGHRRRSLHRRRRGQVQRVLRRPLKKPPASPSTTSATKSSRAPSPSASTPATPPTSPTFRSPACWATLSAQGKIVDVNTFIPEDWLKQQYNESWLRHGHDGRPDGRDHGRRLVPLQRQEPGLVSQGRL